MDKAHKAISEALILISALCGAGTIAEDEIKNLVHHTKEFVQEVKQPLASGIDPKQLEELKKQQQAFFNIANAPAFRNRLTPEQNTELNLVFGQLPWNFAQPKDYDRWLQSLIKAHQPANQHDATKHDASKHHTPQHGSKAQAATQHDTKKQDAKHDANPCKPDKGN